MSLASRMITLAALSRSGENRLQQLTAMSTNFLGRLVHVLQEVTSTQAVAGLRFVGHVTVDCASSGQDEECLKHQTSSRIGGVDLTRL